MGQEYKSFDWAFTHARRQRIGLRVQGNTIRPTDNLFDDKRYEAYNRLIKLHKPQEAISGGESNNFPIDSIERSVKIRNGRFNHQLNPKIVGATMTAIKPLYDNIFLLPREWQFSSYSLGDFRMVFEAISAMAFIRLIARRKAIAQGCHALGYIDSVYVPTCEELKKRVVRYSGVSESTVQTIFDDLSYGNRDIYHPDPALQPLIKLNSECYAVMPQLWRASSAERNLTVLFNRLPSEREIYSKLKSKKEELLRERFTTRLSSKGYRFIYGEFVRSSKMGQCRPCPCYGL